MLKSLQVKSQQSEYLTSQALFLENTAEVEKLPRDALAASQNTLETKVVFLMELYRVAIVLSVRSAVRLKSPHGAGTWDQTAAQQMVTIKLVILASRQQYTFVYKIQYNMYNTTQSDIHLLTD